MELKPIKEIFEETNSQHKSEMGIRTGIPELDKKIKGLHNSNLILVGGRPTMGVKSLMLTFARNAAALENKRVGIFTLTMTEEDVSERLFDINQYLSNGEGDSFHALTQLPIFVNHEVQYEVNDWCKNVSQLVRREHLDIIFLDGLVDMLCDPTPTDYSQEQKTKIQKVWMLSRELDIPIVASAPVSGEIDETEDREPELTYLGHSYCRNDFLASYADTVLFVVRHENYGITEWAYTGDSLNGKALLLIRKNQHGPSRDQVWAGFDEETRCFYSIPQLRNKY